MTPRRTLAQRRVSAAGGRFTPYSIPRPPRPPGPPGPLAAAAPALPPGSGSPPPLPPPLPPTPYAAKYGIVDWNALPALAGTGHSGLAPFTLLPKTQMHYFLRLAMEAQQREQFLGFTMQELVDLGAHERQGQNFKHSNLTGPIHPIFDRGTQWVSTLVPHDIGNNWGVWDISNDYLWSVLEPSFQLATRLIENCHIHPWFLALLFGERRRIEDHRFPNGRNEGWREYYVSFHNAGNVPPDLVRATWMEMAGHIKWAFGINLGDTIRARTKHTRHTNCAYLPAVQRVLPIRSSRIEISTATIFSLLYPDISIAERLIVQFSVAKTIVHELCHALGVYAQEDLPRNPVRPASNSSLRVIGEKFFYEDEHYVELGFSFEKSVFGGATQPFLPHESYGHERDRLDLSFPPVGLVLLEWPHFGAYFSASKDTKTTQPFAQAIRLPALYLGQFTPKTISTAWMPIHLSWIEDIQQEDYWRTCVDKWGADMCKPFPRIFGQRSYIDPSNPQGPTICRHFGGKRSVAASKAQFPRDQKDLQLHDMSVRRFLIVKEVCENLRRRRAELLSIKALFGPLVFWDPDSEAGDVIPIIDDEMEMREAIAEALGKPRAELDPDFSIEWLVKYFATTPQVPRERNVDIGNAILTFMVTYGNLPNGKYFTWDTFVNLPETALSEALRRMKIEWGYPPMCPWNEIGDSFGGIRRARKVYQEQLAANQKAVPELNLPLNPAPP